MEIEKYSTQEIRKREQQNKLRKNIRMELIKIFKN